MHNSSADQSAIVIGGGIAGIAAAVRLAQRGVAVTLVETRKHLGGRATSFVDPTTAQVLDNCQHVLLGCCTNLLDLYEHLGVKDRIEWHRRLYFCNRAGVIDELEADDLPAPLHMTRGLMGFKSLTLAEKFAISRGMLAMMRQGASGRAQWADRSFHDWLIAHNQPPGAIQKFWATIAISACNELPQRMAASYAMQVFQDGFLAHEDAYVMGLPAVPLVELYDAAERVIQAAGGRLMLGVSAERLTFDCGRITGLIADGKPLSAGAFVSTVPFDRLAKLASPALRDADGRLANLDAFTVSPIVGIHLSLQMPGGEPMMQLPHLILTQSPLQWIFNKGTDPDTGGQHLHGVISAAHDLVDRPADELIELTLAEIRHVLPRAREAKLLHGRVVKEKRAAFSITPGLDRYRPGPRGEVSNLYLAGDWCDTGWPATMEGAARSGYVAAAALLADLGKPVDQPLVADLQPSAMYRFIAGR